MPRPATLTGGARGGRRGSAVRCINLSCRARLKESILHFARRTAMDIDGLGAWLVDSLVDGGLVKNFADLYELKAEQLAVLEKESTVGEKKAAIVADGIARSRAAIEESASLSEMASEGRHEDPEPFRSALRRFVVGIAKHVNGLGDTLAGKLVDYGLVQAPADLYRLTTQQLAGVPLRVRLGEKSARRIMDGLEQSKKLPLGRLLFGLGIRHVGDRTASLLADHFGSLDAIASAIDRGAGAGGRGRAPYRRIDSEFLRRKHEPGPGPTVARARPAIPGRRRGRPGSRIRSREGCSY